MRRKKVDKMLNSTFKPATESEISKIRLNFPNNLILILSQPGFLRNVLQFLSPLSLT